MINMAPKRSIKSVSFKNNFDNLLLSDVLCPICRTIIIEPVTLPCNHNFCLSCFEDTVANTNLVCPLCRVRIGSWLRTSKKKGNKLVNNILWEAIKKTFPVQLNNKYNGIEEDFIEDVPKIITAPGEIRQEYERQKAKELEEVKEKRDAEVKASEDLIRKLKEQEEYEESLRVENNRLSEQVAKKLAQEYCFDPGPSSSKLKTTNSKKQGTIDKLLKNMNQKKYNITVQSVPKSVTPKEYTCKILCQDRDGETAGKNNNIDKMVLFNLKLQDKFKKMISESAEASDSNDSIDLECRYFKPIEQRVPLSRKIPTIKVPAIIATANTVIIGPPKGETSFTHSNNGSAFAVVKIIATLPFTITQNEEIIKRNIPGNVCDMVITEIRGRKTINSCKQETKTKLETMESHSSSSHNIKKYESGNMYNQKSPVRNQERTPHKNKISSQTLVFTPSKRKRIRGSPVEEISSKRPKLTNGNLTVSPPFYGFDNKTNNEVKTKINGAIRVENVIQKNNEKNSKSNDIKVKGKLKKLQEEEDFKLAKQLHEELNNTNRYSTRNSINIQVRNVTKPTARHKLL